MRCRSLRAASAACLCLLPLSAQATVDAEGSSPLGALTELALPDGGRLRAAPGHAVLQAEHVRGGQRAIHLVGQGDVKESVLTWELAEPMSPPLSLDLWLERWTRRSPFALALDGRTADGWQPLHDLTGAAVVGDFHAVHRLLRCDAPLQALRFRVRAPAGTGALLDDLRLAPAQPMRVVDATARVERRPVLLGMPHNPTCGIEIDTEGCLEPARVKELIVETSGTTRGILAELAVFSTGNRATLDYRSAPDLFETATACGVFDRVPDRRFARLVTDIPLAPGRNHLWLTARLDPKTARLGDGVRTRVVGLTIDDSTPLSPTKEDSPPAQRVGVALRTGGDGGSRAYRIPGLVTTDAGTLVAAYDIRWRGFRDLPGHIDVGVSRSTDGGRTWGPMVRALDMATVTGEDDPDVAHGDGVGDPAILVDRDTDRLWIAAVWSHGNRGWHGSGPGLTPDETGQLVLSHSDDDGQTWSSPRSITAEVKDPRWRFLLQGPGKGIQMRDGTLVFAAQFKDADNLPHSTILYSTDHGERWQLGTPARPNTTEAQVVELTPGVLMLNMRDNRGGFRSVYTTKDLGKSWQEHPTSRSALIEPVCNAALLRVDQERLLFVNPAVSAPPRRRMTIKLSPDLGATWPEDSQLLLDEGSCAGYPSATMIDDEYVGILFEGSAAQITFMRVPLSEVKR